MFAVLTPWADRLWAKFQNVLSSLSAVIVTFEAGEEETGPKMQTLRFAAQ